MKIFDENEREISEQDIDVTKGKLVAHEHVLRKHHEAIPEIAEVSEEVPVLVYPYQDAEGIPIDEYEGELSEAFGVETRMDIITEYQPPVEAWDEYEDAQTYVLYTDAELAEHRVAELKRSLADSTDDVLTALIDRVMALEASAGKAVRKSDAVSRHREMQAEIAQQQDIITAAKSAKAIQATEGR